MRLIDCFTEIFGYMLYFLDEVGRDEPGEVLTPGWGEGKLDIAFAREGKRDTSGLEKLLSGAGKKKPQKPPAPKSPPASAADAGKPVGLDQFLGGGSQTPLKTPKQPPKVSPPPNAAARKPDTPDAAKTPKPAPKAPPPPPPNAAAAKAAAKPAPKPPAPAEESAKSRTKGGGLTALISSSPASAKPPAPPPAKAPPKPRTEAPAPPPAPPPPAKVPPKPKTEAPAPPRPISPPPVSATPPKPPPAAGRDAFGFQSVRDNLHRLFEKSREAAARSAYAQEDYDLARFAVAAWVDEMISCSKWREKMRWPKEELQRVFFNTTNAGEEFFDYLRQLAAAQKDVLEVYATCLALGFQGRYFGKYGADELEALKLATVRRVFGSAPEAAALKTRRLFPAAYAEYAPAAARASSTGAIVLSVFMAVWPVLALIALYVIFQLDIADLMQTLYGF